MDTAAANPLEPMATYLVRRHPIQLRSIASSPDSNLHFPLHIDFAELMEYDPRIARLIFSQPDTYLQLFDDAALWAHRIVLAEMAADEKNNVVEKKFIHVRINVNGSPLECPETFPSIGRVRVQHRGILLTLKGIVIRSGSIKMHEGERKYMCHKCKSSFTVYPEVEARNSISLPSFCPSQKSKPCGGTKFQYVENTIVCHDYQEIKIQESTQVLGVGAIPRSILVILKDDLVDVVKAGDDVIVTGLLTARWSPELKDVRCDLDPVLIANNVRRVNGLKSETDISDDVVMKFKQFWGRFKDAPLKGRNAILRGICPQIFGLFTVKLAVTLTLIGGVQHVDASGTRVRGESHLLLVGDPGTGKSQFLKYAAKLSNRSVITTGLGSTSAGLTVTAVKDGGEWMLEAGALVLADGGLCCIDEFDRFDIVLVLLDTKNPEWDAVVSSHILSEAEPDRTSNDEDLANTWPLPTLKRYIHYVKENFRPVLTREAETVISSYYQLQRKSATDNAARTTVRMLESLIRLAQAHARLMFRNEVTRLDAITAILCIESSMTTSAIVDCIGNALHSNFTDNPDQEYAKQEKLILEKLG
ncbi:probable DNA helicase MCM9 isoform X2 [Cicer arietinum]|uniref:probable DNA helicase MCM9 isoform X2 n=1 Tax=Cicer arietinum TaxID=3827 RepID=UPI003CC5AB15